MSSKYLKNKIRHHPSIPNNFIHLTRVWTITFNTQVTNTNTRHFISYNHWLLIWFGYWQVRYCLTEAVGRVKSQQLLYLMIRNFTTGFTIYFFISSTNKHMCIITHYTILQQSKSRNCKSKKLYWSFNSLHLPKPPFTCLQMTQT